MAPPPAFTAEAQQVNDAWNAHLRTEFSAHSAEEALATLVAHPRVNQVPVMIGGEGRDEFKRLVGVTPRQFRRSARIA